MIDLESQQKTKLIKRFALRVDRIPLKSNRFDY